MRLDVFNFKKPATPPSVAIELMTAAEPKPPLEAETETVSRAEKEVEVETTPGHSASDQTARETVEFLAEAAPDGIVLLLIPGALREREERIAELDREILTLKRRLKELYKKRNDIIMSLPPTHQAQPPQEGEAA